MPAEAGIHAPLGKRPRRLGTRLRGCDDRRRGGLKPDAPDPSSRGAVRKDRVSKDGHRARLAPARRLWQTRAPTGPKATSPLQ